MTSAKFYIANTGMITSIGDDTEMTAAAVKASISGYARSPHYQNSAEEDVTMALVPADVLDNLDSEIDAEIDEGDRYNARHDAITRMAIIALQQACSEYKTEQAIPLILALSEAQLDTTDLAPLIPNLAQTVSPWVNPKLSRCIRTGRAAGIEALDLAFRYLYDSPHKYIAVGGSDSYQDEDLLTALDKKKRLLSISRMNSFAPGEGAGFLLLTRYPELAQVNDGNIIALYPPGISAEEGHMYSDQPYKGAGLDQAFKQALASHQSKNIHSIYSSMNGEHFWAKEFGVAHIRNRAALTEDVTVEHPADCYGDLGAATAPILIALAAHDLLNNPSAHAHLVYSSSDTASRGAVVVEKQPAQTGV